MASASVGYESELFNVFRDTSDESFEGFTSGGSGDDSDNWTGEDDEPPAVQGANCTRGSPRIVDVPAFTQLRSWLYTFFGLTNNCIGLHRADTGRRDVYAIHPAPRIFNESNILWT